MLASQARCSSEATGKRLAVGERGQRGRGAVAGGCGQLGNGGGGQDGDRCPAGLRQRPGAQHPAQCLDQRVVAALPGGAGVGLLLGRLGRGQRVEHCLHQRDRFRGQIPPRRTGAIGPLEQREPPIPLRRILARFGAVGIQPGQQVAPRAAQQPRVLEPRRFHQHLLHHRHRPGRRGVGQPVHGLEQHVRLRGRDLPHLGGFRRHRQQRLQFLTGYCPSRAEIDRTRHPLPRLPPIEPKLRDQRIDQPRPPDRRRGQQPLIDRLQPPPLHLDTPPASATTRPRAAGRTARPAARRLPPRAPLPIPMPCIRTYQRERTSYPGRQNLWTTR